MALADALNKRLMVIEAKDTQLSAEQRRDVLAAVQAYGECVGNLDADQRIEYGLLSNAFLVDTQWIECIR